MKLSEELVEKLNIVSKLSPNVVLVEGKKQQVKLDSSNYITFELSEDFEEKIAIFNVKSLLSTLDIIRDNTIEFKNNTLKIKNDSQRINFKLGNMDIIEPNVRNEKVDFDKLTVENSLEFEIPSDQFNSILKIANEFNCTIVEFDLVDKKMNIKLITEQKETIYNYEFDVETELIRFNTSKYDILTLQQIHKNKESYKITLYNYKNVPKTIMTVDTGTVQYHSTERVGV